MHAPVHQHAGVLLIMQVLHAIYRLAMGNMRAHTYTFNRVKPDYAHIIHLTMLGDGSHALLWTTKLYCVAADAEQGQAAVQRQAILVSRGSAMKPFV